MFIKVVINYVSIFKVGMASKTLGGAGGVLPLPEKALGESMEKGGRKMQGRQTVRIVGDD